MCIYCGTNKYRKIYEHHHGLIPKEENGRTYEIHHIDGNHSNNNPSNLVAVSLQEHYSIHKSQKDHFACWKMSAKMKLTPEEQSELAKLAGQKGGSTTAKLILINKHPLQRRPDGSSVSKDRISTGTHPFSKRDDGSSVGGDIAKKMVKNGTHPLLGKNHSGSENPRFDSTIYQFEHTNGIVEKSTRHDFMKKYKIPNNGKISELINNKRKTYKGWKINL